MTLLIQPRLSPGRSASLIHSEGKRISGMPQSKRILVTQAGEFMEPMLSEVLTAHGADVVASEALLAPQRCLPPRSS